MVWSREQLDCQRRAADMALITCVVAVLISTYAPSLLAAPSQDYRRLPDSLIERPDSQLDVNATSVPEELTLRRHQPQEVQLRNYPPQHNNFNNVRRRHRKRKLLNGMRPFIRRSESSGPALGDIQNKDSEVAIILAKLNPGADGTPSSVRPYRLEAGGRELTPLYDQSQETLSDILHALKLQVTERKKANDLNKSIFANATHKNNLELERQLPPSVRSKANESIEDKLKVPQFISLENLAETYTEPTFESVIQSRADAETASTPPLEYFDNDINYEATTKFDLGIDEIISLKDEKKSNAENKVIFGQERISIEPADIIARDENGPLITDALESEPTHYLQTDDGAYEPCLTDNAPTQADFICDACKEGDSPCSACKNADSKCEAYKQGNKDDLMASPPGTCPGLPTFAGRDSVELLADQKDDAKDAVIKEDVGLSVNSKSYKISIIFQ